MDYYFVTVIFYLSILEIINVMSQFCLFYNCYLTWKKNLSKSVAYLFMQRLSATNECKTKYCRLKIMLDLTTPAAVLQQMSLNTFFCGI